METSSTNLLLLYKLVIFHVLAAGSVPRHANPGTEAHCVRCVGPHILEDSGARPVARPRHPAPLRRPGVANIDPKFIQQNWVAQKNTQAPPQAGHLAPLPYGAKRTTDAPIGQQFGYNDDWQIHIHISTRFV